MGFFKTKTKAKADPVPIPNTLDSYIDTAPAPQNMIDIFAGEWSSKFPGSCGVEAGGVPLFEDARIHWMFHELQGVAGLEVLELGPLEGGHSYLLDRAGAARVLSIESNRRAFLKCLIAKELTGMPSVAFQMGDFRPYLKSTTQRFDLCVASGVLYHMRDPVDLLADISRCCSKLFLWTHYYDREPIGADPNLSHRFTGISSHNTHHFGYQLHRYHYLEGLNNAGFCGGNASYSNWLSRPDLFRALEHFGYREIRVYDEQREHKHGPCLSLLALQ